MSVESSVPGFTRRQLWLVLGALAMAVLLASLETSIIATAMPTIAGQFNAFESYAWVGTAYIVTSAIGTPLLGKLSDLYGRRRIFLVTLAVFIVGSLLCGLAQSMGQLIAARAFQGLGGGSVQALAFAILGDILPPRERGRYIGYFTLAFVGSALLGPLVGGFIIDHWSWPWIFYINLPLGLLALLLALMLVPDSQFGKRAEQVDAAGLLLLAVGIGCLQALLERGERQDWFASREIVALAVVSFFSLIALVWQELRHEHPVVELRIVRDPQFAASLVFTFLLGGALYSTVFVFPVYAQTLLGFTAWETGMVILPGALASGLTMAIMGRVTASADVDLRVLVVIGAAVFGYAMWQHSLFTVESGWDEFLPAMILRGIGLGMVFIPLNNLALGNLPAEQVANGSGLYNLTRQLGGSVGIATSATLYSQFLQSNRGEMIRHVNEFSAATAARLAKLKAIVMAHGTPEALAQGQALRVLERMVDKQAAMLAFERLFFLFGIALLSALPLLLLMKRGKFARGGDTSAH